MGFLATTLNLINFFLKIDSIVNCHVQLVEIRFIINRIILTFNTSNFYCLQNSARTNCLRGNSRRIVKRRFLTDIDKHSFKNRIVNAWNELSEDTVQATSLNNLNA